MSYSAEAQAAAASAMIALQRSTIGSKADFGEALQAALSLIVSAMVTEGAPEAAIEGALHTGIEWAVEAPDEVIQ